MSERSQLKHKVYMNIAKEVSKLGTCNRLKVGCVLLRIDGSVASTGYNGAPSLMPHCTPETCNEKQRCLHTSHAEENACFFSSGNVHTAYITHEPCLSCSRMMARRGVKIIFFDKPYSSMAEQEQYERQQIFEYYGISCKELK